ncbi:MAG: hypothetical protein AAF411_16430 [Myxococcota bacterium]
MAIARAQHGSVLLTYEAPDACPNERQFRDLVIARLGYDPFGEDGDAAASVLVKPERAAFRAAVHYASGERSLPASASCDELVTTAATALAIAIDPLAPNADAPEPADVSDAPPVVPAEPAEPAAEPLQAPVRERDPHSRTRQRELEAQGYETTYSATLRPILPVSLAVALGIAPAALPRFRVGAGLSTGAYSIVAAFRAARTFSDARVASEDVSVRVLSGELSACARYRFVEGCAFGEWGRFRARANELVGGGGALPWAQLGTRLLFRWRLHSRVHVGLAAELAFPVARARLLIDGAPAWRAPPLTGALGIHLEVLPVGAP